MFEKISDKMREKIRSLECVMLYPLYFVFIYNVN